MKLTQNIKGISKLVITLLLIIFFLLGATFSYIWTMGFYAPREFNLPSQTSLTIENVQFYPEDPTFFNVTVLNPSYSPSNATIEQIKVTTADRRVHSIDVTSPVLPLTIAPGKSQTIKSLWYWGGNYTSQNVHVYVLIAEGSGTAIRAKTTFMNLTVTNVIFEPSVTATRFNVTVESMGSTIKVNIDKILVNNVVVAVTPSLPYMMNPNASVTFTLQRVWTDLQNKTVLVGVLTEQGYRAYKSVTAPQVKLNVVDFVFYNTTETSFYFNMTIQNSMLSQGKIDINVITVYVEGENITIGTIVPALPQTLQPNDSLLLTSSWNWSGYLGKNITVTVYTTQGFKESAEATVPSTP